MTVTKGIWTDLETELDVSWMKFLDMMSSTAKE